MFFPVAAFFPHGREDDSIAVELEGALLISRSVFPYFMLVAFEAGGPLRAFLLLLVSPLVSLLESLRLHAAALHVMIFVSTAGLRVAHLKAVAKVTLPRFFLQDTSEKAYGGLSSCGGMKYVITSMPRIMVESFLKEYLQDVVCIVGTELRTVGGRCLGMALPPGVMVGHRRLDALKAVLAGNSKNIDVGLCDGLQEHQFMPLCRETYIVPPETEATPLPRQSYPKPLIFHDGRLVARPTPFHALVLLLWLPASIPLAVARILAGIVLPYKMRLTAVAALGLRVRASFSPTAAQAAAREKGGTLYACCHRTLLDPVITSLVLQRRVVAVTYSLSIVSEVLSPIPTVRLSRDRTRDGETMRALLRRGDLVVCPEGTTCREPYLLRFSPLFAEVAEDIVPLAVEAEGSMFYGSTVRGHKWLDSFFFLMNPSPMYRLLFLDRVTGGDSRSSYDVANRVQKAIAGELGYECTNFTRRDKYRMITGNDGVAVSATAS